MTWFKRILLFGVTNILMVVTISMILSFLGVGNYVNKYADGVSTLDYQSLMVFCLVWGMVGSIFSLLISKFMAKKFMGVEVVSETDPRFGGLVRSVHRLAQRAGLKKMPEVGVYSSPEINAFATGPTKNNSLVAVSTGLLQSMNADEVEGVLGHEVAHIANGDMVTMTLLQGVVNAFVMFFARILAFAVSNFLSKDDERSSPMVQMLLVFVFEIVFGLLGMMVVAAFSRWREFRADSGGAQLAGKNRMISALEALRTRGANRIADASPAVASMKISSKKAGGLMALLSTHPPLELRLERLSARV